MLKTELYGAWKYTDLENDINEFLSDIKDHKVIDIKLAMAGDKEDDIYFTAMIIYEINSKNSL